MREIWKDIEGYENYYKVSNLGRIKRLPRVAVSTDRFGRPWKKKVTERIMPIYPWANKGNNHYAYDIVLLCKDGTQKRFYVHKLVAEAFVKKKADDVTVHHLDGNSHNNCADNLEWSSSKNGTKLG